MIKLKKLGISVAIAASLVALSAPSFAGEKMDVASVAKQAQIQGLERVTQKGCKPFFSDSSMACRVSSMP